MLVARVFCFAWYAAAALFWAGPSPAFAQLDAYVFINNTDFDPCPSPCVRVGNCGAGTNVTCDPKEIAAQCDATPPCLAFNSNGWLKGCASSECGSELHLLGGVSSWVKHNGYWPPAPVAAVEDQHYPPEESREEAVYTAELPMLLSSGDTWAVLQQQPNGTAQNVSIGAIAFDTYLLLWVKSASPVAVIERAFGRWAAISLLRVGTPSEVARLRRGVGRIWNLSAPSYSNLTSGQPSYYDQAAWQPDDYIAQRIANASSDGESSFNVAAAFLPPNVRGKLDAIRC